ncbi:MAG: methyltransferase [Thiotrichales bacterium]|jgi:16S rRNA G1207 methylase RsmC|nr:methyltransferase [Thiotrichales bacterium]MBT3614010.1 methyltransferase [Thiotrichales bacterium]MBT3752069.1 methyltransferase [Thiotrichales bacterium]MBT3836783.1 methyltransferase [Thiotrichales bacterium]MBT4151557.1 methyltransferase [Thiotrichales bacterium]
MQTKGCESVAKIKQDLNFNENLLGEDLKFKTTWGLFSPRAIDEGTQLMLSHIDKSCNIGDSETILDIGCGYGPLGLALGKRAFNGRVHLVDRDYIAVEYAQRNAEINSLNNCRAYLSNGLSEVPKDIMFDTVVSNIPAKVGREMLTILLCDTYAQLKPGGQMVVVTINGLRDFIKNNFKHVFGNYKKLKQGKSYTVARAIKE